jgi:FkbM family methyltransferase
LVLRQLARGLRDRLPAGARRLAYRAAAFLQSETVEDWSRGFPSIEGTLGSMKARGFDPRFAIDVGAYDGRWSQYFRREFPACRILMVEAMERKAERLREVSAQSGGSIDFRIAILGARHGQSVRWVEMDSGSSALEEHSGYPREVTTRTLTTLDQLLGSDAPPVDFVKLDVQGYELEVLRGATRAMGQAQAVYLEVSLVPINDGCPLLHEVVSFMDAAGFRLLDFCSQTRRKDGVLWQTDLMFVRTGSPLVPEPVLDGRNWV